MDTTIDMPVLQPIKLKIKKYSWWRKAIKHFERRKWRVVEDYTLYMPWLDATILIPKGFIFDGVSSPRAFWAVLNPTGCLLIGAMYHDFGYRYNCFLSEDCSIIFDSSKDQRKFFDKQLKDINIHINNSKLMSDFAYNAIRLLGSISWKGHRKNNKNVSAEFEIKKALDK